MNTPPLRVLIVQAMHSDGPSHLAAFLRGKGLAFDLCNVEAGDPVPTQASRYDVIAMLGGEMSANDDLPFLHHARHLMRDAIARDIPVLGHCLGGQVLAQALGAAVTNNAVTEIGWTRIILHDHALAQDWLGEDTTLAVFQWHSQTFAIPEGATLLASNAACAHQAFAFGPHLGMQFHIEVDAEKLDQWSKNVPRAQGERMRADTTTCLAASQQVASRIYERWLKLANLHIRKRASITGEDHKSA
jgi:GMP synthase-like glutamine amidotransferase